MKRHEVDAARIKELEGKVFDLEAENEALKVRSHYAKERLEGVLPTLGEAQAEYEAMKTNVADLTNHARRLEEANERLKLQAEAVHDYQLQTIATPVLATLVGNLWDPRSEIPVGGSELRRAAELAINAAQNLLTAIAERATTDEG